MPKRRKMETDTERSERLDKSAQRVRDAGAQEDDAVDAMVRTSIKLYGA